MGLIPMEPRTQVATGLDNRAVTETTLFFPTSIFYNVDNGRLVTWLVGIDEERKARRVPLVGTQPRFWTDDTHIPDHPLITKVTPNAATDMWGKPLTEIQVSYPFEVPDVRDRFSNTYEADITYDKRIRYDHGIRNCIRIPKGKAVLRPADIIPADPMVMIEPRILTMDIETLYSGQGADGKYPTDPVISIAIRDSFSKKYVVLLNGELRGDERERFLKMCAEPKPELTEEYRNVVWDVRISTCPSEAHLFMELHRVLDVLQPQIIRGWFFCSSDGNREGFDWPYLENRSQNLGFLFPEPRLFQAWDTMAAYLRMMRSRFGEPKSGNSLNAVATEEGIGHKVEHEGIPEMYHNDRAKLLYYNVMDVFLCDTIDEKCFGGVTKFYLEVARTAGCSLSDTCSEMRFVDATVTHWLAENRPLVRQPSSGSTSDREIQGAEVFLPIAGIHGPTAQIDNSGAYTSYIRSFNLSPETKVRPDDPRPKFKTPAGRYYLQEPRGVFPSVLDGLAAKMDALRAAKEMKKYEVQKYINHSFFGNMKNPWYRSRDVDVCDDILSIGRVHNGHNNSFSKSQGFTVLAGDTDSNFLFHPQAKDADELEAMAHVLVKQLNASYDALLAPFGVKKHFLKVKVEDAYVAQLIPMKASGDGEAKKKYACLKRDGSIYVKGFELRRSDRSPFLRHTQEEVLGLVLRTRDKKQVGEYVRKVQRDLALGKFPITDLAIPKGLGSPPKHYIRDGKPVKGCPQHIKAAIWSNENLGTAFDQGDKVFLYHGYVNGKPRTKVFALPWGQAPPPEARIDEDEHIRLNFEKPLEPILEALGMSWYDVISNTSATKLADFLAP